MLFAPNLAWRDLDLKADLESDARPAGGRRERRQRRRLGRVPASAPATTSTTCCWSPSAPASAAASCSTASCTAAPSASAPRSATCAWSPTASCAAAATAAASSSTPAARPWSARRGPRPAQARCSAADLLDRAGGDPDAITGPLITEAARDGDPFAVEQLAALGRWLGEGIASLTAVLDPAVVVIGGGVSEAGDLLLEPGPGGVQRPAHRPRPPADARDPQGAAGQPGRADRRRRPHPALSVVRANRPKSLGACSPAATIEPWANARCAVGSTCARARASSAGSRLGPHARSVTRTPGGTCALGNDLIAQHSLATPGHWSVFATRRLGADRATARDRRGVRRPLVRAARVWLSCSRVAGLVVVAHRVRDLPAARPRPLPAARGHRAQFARRRSGSMTSRPQLVSFVLLPSCSAAWLRTERDLPPALVAGPAACGSGRCATASGSRGRRTACSSWSAIALSPLEPTGATLLRRLARWPWLVRGGRCSTRSGCGVLEAPFAVHSTRSTSPSGRAPTSTSLAALGALVMVVGDRGRLGGDPRSGVDLGRGCSLLVSAVLLVWYADAHGRRRRAGRRSAVRRRRSDAGRAGNGESPSPAHVRRQTRRDAAARRLGRGSAWSSSAVVAPQHLRPSGRRADARSTPRSTGSRPGRAVFNAYDAGRLDRLAASGPRAVHRRPDHAVLRREHAQRLHDRRGYSSPAGTRRARLGRAGRAAASDSALAAGLKSGAGRSTGTDDGLRAAAPPSRRGRPALDPGAVVVGVARRHRGDEVAERREEGDHQPAGEDAGQRVVDRLITTSRTATRPARPRRRRRSGVITGGGGSGGGDELLVVVQARGGTARRARRSGVGLERRGQLGRAPGTSGGSP